MLKRTLSVLLVLVMLCTLLSACSSGNPGNSSTVDKSSTPNSTPTQSQDKPDAENTGSTSEYAGSQWWVGDEPITVTAIGHMGVLFINKTDYNDVMGMMEFSKRTNLYLDWTTMTNDENEAEQINLSFASKAMPALYTHINKSDAVKYGGQGALIDLMPLIDEYGPNIKKALEADPATLQTMLTEDGKLFMIPQVDADYRLASFKMLLIQQGWLDALDLKAPETPDEFLDVLQAFKDNADQLTDQTMIPYSSYVSGNMEGFFDVLGWPFGMLSSRGYVKDGKIVYGVLEPEFKDTVEFAQEMYSRGLLDPDLDANKDDATFEAKITNNRVGIAYVGQGRINTYNQKAGPTFENYEFVPLLSLKNKEGKMVYPATDGLGKTFGLALSINNEHPEETIKAWDYFYSQEGMELSNFGIEGDTFEIEDGHYVYTDRIMNDPEMSSNQAIMNYIFPLFDFPTARIYDFERSLYGPTLAKYKETQYADGAYHEKVLYNLSSLPVSTEQLNEISPVSADLDTYINESLVKFIRGEWTLENNYDQFVSTLKNMRIDDLLAVLNEAYDKLG